jgi:glycosyltransferase involved in cell wall biosynthesis
MARVDVIVPCYNYGRYLRQCVESVLTQEGVEVRVLIIDDCSSDDSEAVGRHLAAADPRVEYRRHPVNRGHIATYNEGIEWLAAEYALLISADDLLAPGALQRACAFLDSHPDVGFVYGKVIRWNMGRPKPSCDSPSGPAPASIIPGREWIARICAGDPPTTSPEVVVRTSLQKQLGYYRADLPHWADVDLWMRFAARAPVAYIDCDQAYYRIHDTNMNLSYKGLRDLEQRRTTFRSLFGTHRHLIPNGEQLEVVAFRHIAECACWSAHRMFNDNNLSACESYLRFARETYSPISSSSIARRLRWKMAIGRKAWGLVRTVRGVFRSLVRAGRS